MSLSKTRCLLLALLIGAVAFVAVPHTPVVTAAVDPCSILYPCDGSRPIEIYFVDGLPQIGATGAWFRDVTIVTTVPRDDLWRVRFSATVQRGLCMVEGPYGDGSMHVLPVGDELCEIRISARYEGRTATSVEVIQPVRVPATLRLVSMRDGVSPLPASGVAGQGESFTVWDGLVSIPNDRYARGPLTVTTSGPCSVRNSGPQFPVGWSVIYGPGAGTCAITTSLPDSIHNLAGSTTTYVPVSPGFSFVDPPKFVYTGDSFLVRTLSWGDLVVTSVDGPCSLSIEENVVVADPSRTGRCTVNASLGNLTNSFAFDVLLGNVDSIRFVPGYAPPTTVGINDPPGRFRVEAFSDGGGDILEYLASAPCAIQNASRYRSDVVGRTVLGFDLTVGGACQLRFLDFLYFDVGEPPYRRFDITAVDRPANTPPTSAFSYRPTGALPAVTYTFDGSSSTDTQGDIRGYVWDFGNGTTGFGALSATTYAAAGTYPVTLTVTDQGGLSTTSTQQVTVDAAVVPGAPVGVAAMGSNTASATVSFLAPAADGGAVVTSYRAVCSSTNGGTARSASGPASPLVVSGLSGGSQYQCRVNATNAAGTGPGSAPSAAFTAIGRPQAPTIGGVTNAGAGSVNVGFTPVTATGGSPITSYQATCTSTNGGGTRSATGTSSPLLVTTLTRAATYSCVVRASTAVGTSSASAATPTFTALALPDPPSGLTATMTTPSRVSVGFTPPAWNGGSPVTSYRVVCTTAAPGVSRSASSATGPILVISLSPASSYSCRASATTAIGTSTASAPVAITTP